MDVLALLAKQLQEKTEALKDKKNLTSEEIEDLRNDLDKLLASLADDANTLKDIIREDEGI